MSMSIISYLQSMFHTVKKEDVIKTAEFVFSNLNNDVIPALDNIINNADVKLIKDSDLLHNISTLSKVLKAKDNKDVLVKLKASLVSINDEYKPFLKLINELLSDNVTDSNSNARDGAIMRILNDIGAMNKFVLDLVYMIIMDEKETLFPKIKFRGIRENIPTFIVTIDAYGKDFGKLLKEVEKVSTVSVNINDGNINVVDSIMSKSGISLALPKLNGFVNNPLYHIRMWLVDREIDKYESLKDEKKLIELRLLELKLQEEGTSADEKLKKQIEYYENKLAKLEYQLEKIEKD